MKTYVESYFEYFINDFSTYVVENKKLFLKGVLCLHKEDTNIPKTL